jgi:hypothetical protein
MRAVLDLDGLNAKDVRVEAVIGCVGVSGQLEETQVMTLLPVEQKGSTVVFAKEFVPHQTGRLGYSLRAPATPCSNGVPDSLTGWSQLLQSLGDSKAIAIEIL